MTGPFALDFLTDHIPEGASVRRIHPQDVHARLIYAQHELAFLAYREDQRTEWGATLRWFAQRRLGCTPAQCARIFHYMLTLERIIP